MDILGASMLSARIRAGVRIGQMIELLGDADTDTGAEPKRGELGLVTGFTAGGNIVVKWGGGVSSEVDPATDSYRAVLPRMAHTA